MNRVATVPESLDIVSQPTFVETTGRRAEEFVPSPETVVYLARRRQQSAASSVPLNENGQANNPEACKAYDPEMFFPTEEHMPGRGGGRLSSASKEAKRVCDTCAVSKICLQYALERGEIGIWGGTTTRQRKEMKGR
ncbi:WhiB family transcriptional regulator [Candidatus Saccharibacteria bacterium]|nr:MAG: WhiB family transcriptional regulator [Candidatus Saccharibacteria bacterium]